ncbi:Asp-tRNA(Asn)/Glu-tRNA(Gln) amidotransferase subunit GatC [Deinococcus peraridilitoris]|uniref:Aspartyl/glutamyl-tRNA(Asn/Gln) amidotransferase subunit C n=1 Tax=Deinococcus peraridilitoris (strain DSM 19664 / LMG 22246 / CIP 109416 / KR-200) TaxID=937777 RepID=L0A6P3_DEIPD|nr:Asp-tRNA(Asn)/Glu-tRNA(Gln) amidotransferase subunit GatC [Deinococcus peraridilitoris]AFZ68690.1 glutamyl-tRNA(Gln) and/or aspartyl-tRNA(Asn) amidotransferase, C subunit [Deinococcus peraridilitoris DSM 19664]
MIDAAEMAHLTKLARLQLTEDETARMQGDLNKILGYFEKLQELDTEGVQEMQRPVALENIMREDEPEGPERSEMFSQAQALELAVEQQEGFFKVPRTVEQ